MVVGFAAGVATARRATRPLHNVVETARQIITTGALDARVPAPLRNDDIAELVNHFNTVLDKNSTLLRTMREALDNVAHDLRTPLTSLRGTAELALSRTGDENATREALADCVERADEVLRLLRALMEISEAEAGMLKLDKTACDLGEVAERAADLYTELADARKVGLIVEAVESTPVVADTTRLRQAIANVIDNAIKYTPEGGQVILRTAVREGDAVLEVRDTGPGIPLSEQPRIWERLYRGDQSRSQSGLGLGLSLVRAIVEAHGGRVTVRNAPDRGAIFELRFPLSAKPIPVPATVV
jgi:signal transduction histidine kinase